MSNQITPNPSVPTQVVQEMKFPRFINNLGIIPTSYKDSMSYYESLAWLCKFLEESVIPTLNENGEAVEELQGLYVELNNYVAHYFDTLDVQEEINNKLDDMVEAGTLQEIIADYLNSKAIFGFDNVDSMLNATNLISGSYARTLGYYSKNDGGGALYKIRTVTNDDVIDNMTILSMNDSSNELIAELIFDDSINLLQIGCYGNNTNDDTLKINNILTYARTNNLKITSPKNANYLISNSINISNVEIDLNYATITTNNNIDMIYIDSSIYYGTIKNITINCNNSANSGIYINQGKKQTIENVIINNIKNYGIYYKSGYEIYINNIHLNGYSSASNSCGIYAKGNDSYINNIIMIDCKTSIHVDESFNYYSNIHSWILTDSLVPDSKFINVKGGRTILNDCYCDTYQYCFYNYNTSATIITSGLNLYYNKGIYNSTLANSYNPYFSFASNVTENYYIKINNSMLQGYSNELTTKLTNLTNFAGEINGSSVTNFDHNLPFAILDLTNATSTNTIKNSIEKIGKLSYIELIAEVTVTANTRQFTLGNIPNFFHGGREIITSCNYGTNQYNVTDICYLYISNVGKIDVQLPFGITPGTYYVKIYDSFIGRRQG